jgi:hypothetical protein
MVTLVFSVADSGVSFLSDPGRSMTLHQSLFSPNDLVLSRVMLWSVNTFLLSPCVSLAADFLVLFIMDYLYIQAFGKSQSHTFFVHVHFFWSLQNSQSAVISCHISYLIYIWMSSRSWWMAWSSVFCNIFFLSWNYLTHNKGCLLSIIHSI